MMDGYLQDIRLYIIGVPVSQYEGLEPEAKELLAKADKIYCSNRFFETFQKYEFLKSKLALFPEKISLLPEVLKKESGDIVVLATGDPNFYGITSLLIKGLQEKVVKVIPAVSTMQSAFAKLKLNWESAHFFSLHGKNKDGLLAFLLKSKKGFIFTSNSSDTLYILKTLKDYRLDDYRVYIFENLGLDNEKLEILTFPYLLKRPISDLNVVIFEREGELKDYIGIGLEDEEYEKKKGMITKREIRVNVLSLLSLKEGNVLWDIGAGSGSISIEASYNPKGVLAFAIESDEESFLNLKKNIRKFSAINVKPILAKFKEVYKDLPKPDRIFLGGGGKDWLFNLKKGYELLKENGIMVISIVSLDHLVKAINFFEESKIDYNLTGLMSCIIDKASVNKIFKLKSMVYLLKVQKSNDENN